MDKKIILYIVVVLLVVVALFYYWNNKNKGNVANVRPMVDVGLVKARAKAANPLIIRNPFSKNRGQ